MAQDKANVADPAMLERVQTYMQKHGLTQSMISREAEISNTALSQYLRREYPGKVSTVEAKLEKWFNLRERQETEGAQLPAVPDWLHTPTGDKIYSALAYSQLAGDLSAIYGGAGLGKTSTARRYQADNPRVWIATMSPATQSVASALGRICEAVGIKQVPFGAAKIESALVAFLMDTGGLLILDEAQHLHYDAVESVRSIYDATGIGMALLGNEIIYHRLSGGTRAAHFAQLFSRISRRVHLVKPNTGDVEALIDSWDIRNGARAYCQKIALQPGALRGLTKTLRLAAMYAKADGSELLVKHVKAAWAELGGVEL